MIRSEGVLSKATRFAPKYLFGLGATAYLFSMGWLRDKNRELIWSICEHFGMRLPAREHPLPRSDLKSILHGCDIRLLEPEAVYGNVSLTELAVINALVRKNQPRRIFEIGTFDGRTALNMAANAPGGAQVFTLDLPADMLGQTRFGVGESEIDMVKKTESGLRFKGTEYGKRITQLYGDSASFDFSPYVGTMDFVFVDGSHTSEYVLSDSEAALKLIQPDGGIILYHDYYEYAGGVSDTLGALHRDRCEFAGLRHIQGTGLAYAEIPSRHGGVR